MVMPPRSQGDCGTDLPVLLLTFRQVRLLHAIVLCKVVGLFSLKCMAFRCFFPLSRVNCNSTITIVAEVQDNINIFFNLNDDCNAACRTVYFGRLPWE